MDTKEQKLSQCLESLEKGAKKLDIVMNFLTQEEKRPAVELIAKGGMEFVKISDGIFFPSATEENVKLLYSVSRNRPKIKASSGIKAKEQGVEFLLLGAESIRIF